MSSKEEYLMQQPLHLLLCQHWKTPHLHLGVSHHHCMLLLADHFNLLFKFLFLQWVICKWNKPRHTGEYLSQVKKEAKNSLNNKGVWLKRELDFEKKRKDGALPELCSTGSPLGPTITSPSSSSSAFPLPTIFSNFTSFCAYSTL